MYACNWRVFRRWIEDSGGADFETGVCNQGDLVKFNYV
jgi:hypothetical protein